MNPNSLAVLPAELIAHICELVATPGSNHLLNFALVNKDCYRYARPTLFHAVAFEISDFENLTQHVRGVVAKVKRLQLHDCVRLLSLRQLEKEQPARVYFKTSVACLAEQASLRHGSLQEEDIWPRKDEASPRINGWQDLADLIAMLPALSDVVIAVNAVLPSCVVSAITRKHCKLHLRYLLLQQFKAKELYPSAPALITYEHLKSLHVHHIWRSFIARSDWRLYSGREDYHYEALCAMLKGSSPCLELLRVVQRMPVPPPAQLDYTDYESDWSLAQIARVPASLNGLVTSPGTPPRIRHLQIVGAGCVDLESISLWSLMLDFSNLHSLCLGIYVKLPALEHLTLHCSLSSLKCLKLAIDPSRAEWEACMRLGPPYYAQIDAFIASLPAMEEIRLNGIIYQDTIDTIINKHGPTLKILELHPFWNRVVYFMELHVLQNMSDRCHKLQKLELTLPRHRGSATEVAMYRVLGQLPRLQEIAIVLHVIPYELPDSAQLFRLTDDDYPDAPWDDPSFDDLDRELSTTMHDCRNGDIRNILVNSALDDDLVRSMWGVIQASKPERALRLDLLSLETVGSSVICHDSRPLDELTSRMGATCIARRRISVADADSIVIERKAPKKLGNNSGEIVYGPGSSGPYMYCKPAMPHFRRLWPETSPGSSWENDWHSWPLEV